MGFLKCEGWSGGSQVEREEMTSVDPWSKRAPTASHVHRPGSLRAATCHSVQVSSSETVCAVFRLMTCLFLHFCIITL
jgi:hypothetical protein